MKVIISAKWKLFLENLIKAYKKPVVLFALGFEAADSFTIGYFAQCSDSCKTDTDFQDSKDELTGVNSSVSRIEESSSGQEGIEEGSAAAANRLELPDEECLYSRARQLLRMLPGGIEISGVVLIGSEHETKPLEGTVTRFLKRLRKLRDRHIVLNDEASLLTRHLFAVTIRDSLGNFDSQMMSFSGTKVVTDPGPGFAVRDILWCSLRSTIAMNELGTCSGPAFGVDFQKRFVDLLIPYGQRLLNSYTLINGRPYSGHESIRLSEVLNKENPLAPLEANLLLRSSDQHNITEVELSESVCARMHLTGILAIRTFIPSSCTIEEVVTAFRKDILRTLYTRGELHHEERLVTGAESESNSYCSLPRRVFASLCSPGGGFDVCEYMMHDEDLSFLQNEVGDFFRTTMDASSVELDAEPLMLSQTKVFPLPPVATSAFSLLQTVFGSSIGSIVQSAVGVCQGLPPNTIRILALASAPFLVYWFFELLRNLWR